MEKASRCAPLMDLSLDFDADAVSANDVHHPLFFAEKRIAQQEVVFRVLKLIFWRDYHIWR